MHGAGMFVQTWEFPAVVPAGIVALYGVPLSALGRPARRPFPASLPPLPFAAPVAAFGAGLGAAFGAAPLPSADGAAEDAAAAAAGAIALATACVNWSCNMFHHATAAGIAIAAGLFCTSGAPDGSGVAVPGWAVPPPAAPAVWVPGVA